MHKALLLLRKIPKDKVVSYKELAIMCKTSPRAIGRIMKYNPNPREYPCYKVVKNNGEVGSYSGGEGSKTKIHLLRKDGVKIINGKVNKKYFYNFNV